jgi:hypothetical protein
MNQSFVSEYFLYLCRTPITMFYTRCIQQTFFLQFLYYYQVHESEFRYPIFHVLDKQTLRINKPQSVYLLRDTFSYSTVSVMFLFYYLRT